MLSFKKFTLEAAKILGCFLTVLAIASLFVNPILTLIVGFLAWGAFAFASSLESEISM